MNAPGWRASSWLAVAAVTCAVLVMAVVLIRPRALGHDEAVYAAGARRLWSDDPSLQYRIHRPIGMPVVAAPGVALGGGAERPMRVPSTLIALLGLVAIHRVARRVGGPAAAALAVAVIATTSVWQWRATEVLSDIPAALLLLVAAWVIGADGERAGAGWRRAAGVGAAVGALGAAACYVRYGSLPVVVALWALALVSQPGRWRTLVVAGAVSTLLLAPLIAWSVAETGSWSGVMSAGRRMAGRAYPGAGLVDYLRWWPVRLAGPVTGVVSAIGLVVGLAGWRAGWAGATPVDRWRRLLASAALAQIVIVGWLAHAEPRYVLFALFALVVVGAGYLAEVPARRRAATIVVALTVLPSAVWTVARVDQLAASRRNLVAAATAVRADAGGRPCLVFSTDVATTAWYSGCRTVQIDGWGLRPDRARGYPRVYLIEARGLPRSIGVVEVATRDALGWQPIACRQPAEMCVWRAARVPGP